MALNFFKEKLDAKTQGENVPTLESSLLEHMNVKLNNISNLNTETDTSKEQVISTHIEKTRELIEAANKELPSIKQRLKEIVQEYTTYIEKSKNKGTHLEIRSALSKKLHDIDALVGRIDIALRPIRGNGPYKTSYSKLPLIPTEINFADGSRRDLSEVDETLARELGKTIAEYKKLTHDFFVFSQNKFQLDAYQTDEIHDIAALEKQLA